MMKLKFEGVCPHCQEEIILVRELSLQIILQIIEQAKQIGIESPVSDNLPAEADKVPEISSPIDLDWLKEQLGILQGKQLKAWTNANVLSYLNIITGQKASKVSEAVMHLNKEQSEDFIAKVQESIQMS